MAKKGIMVSYGMGKFIAEFLTGAFGSIVFMFYETEVGLAGGYAALATIIYSVWNAVNDPIIGYVTNKTALFSKKFGRRFVWIIGGLILCSLAFISIFSVPTLWDAKKQPLPVFLWMVLSICLYDGLYSLWEVNYQSIYPDKFRTDSERTTTAAIGTGIGVLGIASGFIIPPLFFSYGVRASYQVCAIVIAAISIVSTLGLSFGVFETKQMITRFSQQHQKDVPPFFSQMRKALKSRNLLAFVLLLFFYQSGCMLMTASINYVVKYVLGAKSSQATPIFAGMLVGTLLSILLWTRVAKKVKNNQRMLILSSFALALFALPLTFLPNAGTYILGMTLWGLGFGGFWTFMSPAMADVIDSLVVDQKRRDDGVVLGIRAFFMRFSYASQAIVFFVVHQATGFDDQNITEAARWGIRLHMGLIPALFFLIGGLLFLKMNRLDANQIQKNRKALSLLDI
ncbi:MFS transporter [Sphaerochaeta globosa]|uniref:Major facilitator superfamily MFS_1 n=1 Tax=Sphaerochaeta globosa (strain ATCC BAA-1886 / DSM 22777 / Buddy) TaxID=158189 RepID=F0RTJ3_SPHGB|nr:MFS transporter [Sphaerochaeta globosa]ADY13902.1 major facilitator superfamily MFS_1 [Sphaerochaeta globosa str. Buddy]